MNGNTGNRHGKNFSAFTRAAVHGVNGMREAKNTMETDNKRAKNEEKFHVVHVQLCAWAVEVLVRKSSIMFDVCCMM